MVIPYVLLSLPGLITAFLIRLLAVNRNWDQNTREWLFALTIGLLCSPGITVGGYGAVAAVMVPSLVAVIISEGHSRAAWGIFVVSTAITTFVTYIAYELMSTTKNRSPMDK